MNYMKKIDNTCDLLLTTVKQRELIDDILSKIEDADRMQEHYDDIQKPNDYPEIRILLRELINEVNHIGININQMVHISE